MPGSRASKQLCSAYGWKRKRKREGAARGKAAGWDKSICNIFYGLVSGTVLRYCI